MGVKVNKRMTDDNRLAQVNAHDNPVLVYTTCPSKEVAKRIGGELVRSRLAACANILPAMQSIYIWQDELHEDDEVFAVRDLYLHALGMRGVAEE